MRAMLRLPYPNRDLSPNARSNHWGKRSRAVKKARTDAGWIAKASARPAVVDGKVHLTITYCPPDNRRRDRDNAEASGKAARDGLADAWGVDDSCFVITSQWGEVVPGGAMVVEFEV